MKILYAGAKKTWHTLFDRVLASREMEVLHANSSQEVKEFLSNQLPDVAIVDMNLGKAETEEILKSLVEIKVPAIVVGHRAEGFNREELLSKGAFVVLEKPFTVEELLQAIKGSKPFAEIAEEERRAKEEIVLERAEEELSLPKEEISILPEESSESEPPILELKEEEVETIEIAEEELSDEEFRITPEPEPPIAGGEEKREVKLDREELLKLLPPEKIESIAREILSQVIPEIAERVIREEVEKLIKSRLV